MVSEIINAAYDWSKAGVVTIAGLSIVFAVLILFVVIIWLFGKVFCASESGASKQHAVKAQPAVQKADSPVKAENFENEDELIAVISAATYAYLGDDASDYRVVSIRPSDNRGRPAWSAAGIANNTRRF